MTCGHGQHVWVAPATMNAGSTWPYVGQPCQCGQRTWPRKRPLSVGRGDKEQA